MERVALVRAHLLIVFGLENVLSKIERGARYEYTKLHRVCALKVHILGNSNLESSGGSLPPLQYSSILDKQKGDEGMKLTC